MIDRITTLDGFLAVRDAWDELYRASGASNLFLTHAWLATWMRHLGRDVVILLSRPAPGAPLDAALPLTAHEDQLCTITHHSARPGPLVRPGVAHPLRPMLLHLLVHDPRARRLVFHRCQDGATFPAQLERELGPLRFVLVDQGEQVSRLIATDAPFERWLESRESKVRHELRRKLRGFSRAEPEAELVEIDVADADAAIALVRRIEEDSWKQAAHTAIISDEHELAFYRSTLALADARTRGRMWMLGTWANPIAYVLGVQHDDSFYALKTSYRTDHAALAPGQVLFTRLVERLCAGSGGIARLELLGGDARWKKELATETRVEPTLEVLRPTPPALLYLAYAHMRPALQAAAERDTRVRRMLDTARRLGRAVATRTYGEP
jgi:CelD/BcsL family acetyltransferase involved in cellulose biosynthesis